MFWFCSGLPIEQFNRGTRAAAELAQDGLPQAASRQGTFGPSVRDAASGNPRKMGRICNPKSEIRNPKSPDRYNRQSLTSSFAIFPDLPACSTFRESIAKPEI